MRLTQRQFFDEADEAVQRRIVPLQPVEIQLGELGRLHLAALDELGQVRHRKKRELLVRRRHRHVPLLPFERSLLTRQRHPRQDGIEDDRGLRAVAQVGSAQRLAGRHVTARPVQDGEKSRLLGRVKGDAGDRLGRLDHVDRHHLGILGNGGERAWHQRRSETQGRKTGDEPTPVHGEPLGSTHGCSSLSSPSTR